MTMTYDATMNAEALPDDWESLVSIGQETREDADTRRWLLGDIACKVATRYGMDALGTFAGEIKVIPRTLRSYRAVAAFYPSGTRYQFANLSYTDYRECARTGDLETALDLLERCADGNWTTRELTDALNVTLGRPPVRRPIIETEVTADERGVSIADALLVPGVTYALKVFANE